MKPRLLIVEDNRTYAKMLRERLQDDFQLFVAHRLSTALNVLRSNCVDAVLLDLTLPDSDREDTLAAVKSHAGGVAVVILSAWSDPDFMAQMIAESASGYLVKGVDDVYSSMLVSSVNQAMMTNQACHLVCSDL